MAGLSTIILIFWLIVAFRVARTLHAKPTVRRGLDAPLRELDGRPPRVSTIVPAHNEQRVIDNCARSLRGQDYPGALEIIFVLDRCTDDTLAILQRHAAEDDRIVIVENDACPDDWAGKCNAARLGAERATGDYLLFTDADTGFDPQLVCASVALAQERDLALLSLLSDLDYEQRFHVVAQPVATMNLLRMYPIERVNQPPDEARPFANGQFMLFRRDDYDALGGHAAVREDLLEDIAFARAVQRLGRPGGIFLADGMLRCSMYDRFDAFTLGWRRIFIEACKRNPKRLRKNAARVFINGVGIPLVQIAAVVVGAVLWATQLDPPLGVALLLLAGSGAVAQLLVLGWIYRLNGAPRWSAVLYPVGCFIVGRLMWDGVLDLVRRRPVPWAGRSYVLEPRFK
jgi:glycosyltransferase involved in cell wall biosynthesis